MFFVALGWLLCAFYRALQINECNARESRLMVAGCVGFRDVLS